jgi:hypothetical protein
VARVRVVRRLSLLRRVSLLRLVILSPLAHGGARRDGTSIRSPRAPVLLIACVPDRLRIASRASCGYQQPVRVTSIPAVAQDFMW